MNNDQKRMFMAIALSAVVLFVWQSYFAPKQPFEDKNKVTKVKEAPVTKNGTSAEPAKENKILVDNVPVSTEVEYTNLEGSQGMARIGSDLSIADFSNSDSKSLFKDILESKGSPFKIFVKKDGKFHPIFMALQEDSGVIKGTNSEFGISFTGSLSKDDKLTYNLVSASAYQYRIVFESSEKTLDNRQVRNFTFLGAKDVDTFEVGDEDSYDGLIKWAGVDFNFHLFALVMDKKAAAKVTNAAGKFVIDFVEPTQNFNSYLVFVKKNYDILTKLGDNLQLSVDFGIFGIIAVPILRGIQFVYKYIPNYGIAIILLTILLRFLTFPLYYKSIVSMKKMQKVQPELTKLREKFKDDPQRMQKETMELFKRAGANPLGGCFPMLLQMPVFFAFYQVLYNSVELVNAPFMGWITDLSIKDPLYVLPVVMAIAMFGQQKLTPTTTADPTQAKVMMAMPLIFGFIMKDLPSGLVLYIFVSTLFGIIQQLVVYKYTD
ncbi:MAG: YidC/Oxa1 family membrane protein insertase [Bacteriovoracaceae bacterium]|jgi:YidC/Oxa1 family membrane protein insertase